jgi:hypothetical protein
MSEKTKLVLKKKTDYTGDVYYSVWKDNEFVSNSVVIGGNVETDTIEKLDECYRRALEKFEQVKKSLTKLSVVETIVEEYI